MKTRTWLIALGLCAIILGWLGYRTQQKPQTTRIPLECHNNITAQNTTLLYTNPGCGIELKYPEDVYVTEWLENPRYVGESPNQVWGLSIVLAPSTPKSPEVSAQFSIYPVDEQNNITAYKQSWGGTDTKLGSNTWTRFSHSGEGYYNDYVEYYLERNGKMYTVRLDDLKYEAKLKEVLSGLTLTK